MKTYFLKVPFTGVMDMVVDADSEEEAFEKAMTADVALKPDIGLEPAYEADICQWGFRREIASQLAGLKGETSTKFAPTRRLVIRSWPRWRSCA